MREKTFQGDEKSSPKNENESSCILYSNFFFQDTPFSTLISFYNLSRLRWGQKIERFYSFTGRVNL